MTPDEPKPQALLERHAILSGLLAWLVIATLIKCGST